MPLAPGRAPNVTPPGIDLPGARAASRQVAYVGLLMFGTLACSALPLPWQFAGMAFAATALVVGVMALRALARAHVRGILPAVVIMSVVFSGLSAISYGATALLWPIPLDRQRCLQQALTVSASDQCEKTYRDALQAKLDQWTRSTAPAPSPTG